MKFGRIDRVAIELDLHEHSRGAWMIGQVCYWICGKRVGNYKLATSLRDVLFCWETITGDAGARMNHALFAMPRDELGATLQRGLFGIEPEDEPLERQAIEEQWARQFIKPGVDVFDDWQVLLVEAPDGARCVYRNYAQSSFEECALDYGEFDSVLSEALQTLRHWYDRALGSV